VLVRTWVKTLKSGLGRINGQRQQIKFQPDYLIPAEPDGKTTLRRRLGLERILEGRTPRSAGSSFRPSPGGRIRPVAPER